MKRKISSAFTFVYKFIAPFVWSIALIILIFAEGITILHFIIWIFGAVGIVFFGVPLKMVFIERTDLVISNYEKEIRVPLSNIEHVSNSHFFIHTVGIRFKKLTDFGRDIIFMPKTLIVFLPFMSHPIVKEINELSRKETN